MNLAQRLKLLAKQTSAVASRLASPAWRRQAGRRVGSRSYRQVRGLIPQDSGRYADSLTIEGHPQQSVRVSGDRVSFRSDVEYADNLRDDTPRLRPGPVAREWQREIDQVFNDAGLTSLRTSKRSS